MDARKGNIYEILNGNRQFLIPCYQRYYSWDLEQCRRLWDDIVAMQKDSKAGHFVGSIVNIAEQAMPTGVQKFMIIDGQQRMTTLTLLLIALRNYAIENSDTSINPQRIDNMLLKNAYESNDEQYKLLLTKNDRDILIGLVEAKPLPKDTRSKLLTNYNFFAEKIASKELNPAEIYESIGKLQIVNITLDRGSDDAQAIFESLNSTGKALTESDLIRNYVLMGLEPDEQTYIYEHLWRPMESLFAYETQEAVMDRFFRDYLTMKIGRIPRQNRIYEEFKQYRLYNSDSLGVRELCMDLLTHAGYYTDMVSVRSDNPTLKSLYKDISDLRMEVSYPFLLQVHDDWANKLVSDDDLIQIIRLCVSYVCRRGICELPTNSLNKTFATLKRKINTGDYVNSIKAFFVLCDDYREFPDDEKFAAAFVSRDIYTMRTRNFILSHLENYDNKAPIIIENCTIEHILPQNANLGDEWQQMLGDNWREIQKRYLHTIGNLTLTAYNSEMSDRPFLEKMNMDGGFKQSALRMNQYLVTLDTWNEQTIKERARQMAEKAKKIWAFPTMSEAELAPYRPSAKTADPQYSRESYDASDLALSLFDVLDRRIMNLSPSVKREFKKLYVAYKLDTNFVDVQFLKNELRMTLNMKFSEVRDPNGLCRDVSGIGRWGNGEVEVRMKHESEVDQIMELVEQSYRKQDPE